MKSFLSLLALAALPVLNAADPVPLPEPAPFTLGAVTRQSFPAGTFFYMPFTCNRHDLAARMREVTPKLAKTLAGCGLGVGTPLMVVYKGGDKDPSVPLDVEVGALVPPGTKVAGEARVRTLPAFTCATVVYTGPFEQVGKAYEVLFAALFKSGQIPTQEGRQMLLYWEGEQSRNNMMLIQVGLQK